MQDNEYLNTYRQLISYNPAIEELFRQYDLTEKDDKKAKLGAVGLGLIAKVSVGLLTELCFSKPELLRPIAEHAECWPTFFSPFPQYEYLHKEVIDRLDIGRDFPVKISKKGKRSWSYNTLVNQLVVDLITRIEKIRSHGEILKTALKGNNQSRKSSIQAYEDGLKKYQNWQKTALKLPKLTKESAQQWFDLIWKSLLETTSDHPERTALRYIGEYRKDHNFVVKKNAKTPEANIRDGIKKCFNQAFNIIVQKEKLV